ncbi:MAG: CCA tRNA nucleotidyltransferase [Actinobacteria bacterium]|nr:MAG: CCA tRNA nucleotidyltransferase [Actinomycetota bacterium]
MNPTIEQFVRSLGLDAYLVGGAVRDELLGLESKDADFVVPGVDYEGLHAALEPHGKVEELEVAGRRVGARLHPRDKTLRALAPAGIEFAPPRAERSTGPGRHDFEIAADPDLSIEDDMSRRDFTVNAMARRLETGEVVDPFGGAEDLRRGVLRTVRPRSFAEDPLRLVRGLRLVAQLGLEPDETTLRQMREEAESIRLVSGERVGGGLHADGLGELSKLLLGRQPARALQLARDTGVLTALLPEFEPALGFEQGSDRQHLPLDEHIFAVVQAAADADASLAVRLGALFHDLGKPAANGDHARRGAELASAAMRRLRYPTRLRTHVTRLVRAHAFPLDGIDELFARRFLRAHGDELAFDLVSLKDADLRGKTVPASELDAVERLRTLLEEQRSQPHRLTDLAIDGTDLIELGYAEGPELGRALDSLLDAVVERPELNTREELLDRARELRP